MRITIVEDNPLLRENLTFLLAGERDFEVVGSHATAEEALDHLNAERPDLLLVDIGLPGMGGVELIRTVRQRRPEVEIMVHTVFDNRDTVFAAIKAGATGYILKGASPRELVEAIHTLMAGGAPMSRKIARSVIREFQGAPVEEEYLLTPREREILAGVEQGYTYKELGERLRLSPHTIHSHIKKIYEKLHAKSRREALVAARRKGIL